MSETSIDKKLFPRAWKAAPSAIQIPAKVKLDPIILSAGIPISSIAGDALKKPRSLKGLSSWLREPFTLIFWNL